jgi:hypothetical protein
MTYSLTHKYTNSQHPLFGRSGRGGAQIDLNCATQPVIAEESPAVQPLGGDARFEMAMEDH